MSQAYSLRLGGKKCLAVMFCRASRNNDLDTWSLPALFICSQTEVTHLREWLALPFLIVGNCLSEVASVAVGDG